MEMDVKELPQGAALEWKNPDVPAGRHLSTDFIPLAEYLAMRKRIGGRSSFVPKTSFDIAALDELNKNPLMGKFDGGYVFSSYSTEPETLLFWLQAIEMFRPRVILELGSGLSTLLLSDAHHKILEQDKVAGKYVALEQSQGHMDKVRGFAAIAGVEKFFDPLIQSLVRYRIGDVFDTDEKAMPCFDFDEKALHEALGGVRPDMIIVDGPADDKTLHNASFAKTLTVPILSLYAAPGAVALMDNCYADPETFAIEQWQSSGSAYVPGVKAVGKGGAIVLLNQGMNGG